MRREETEILIVGGGTAGFAAALSAARKGRRVALIEATSKIGGVMSFCPGMPWGGGFPAGSSIGGIFEELVERLRRQDPPAAEIRPCALANFGPEVLYDHEAALFAMFEMLAEAKVTLHLSAIAGTPRLQGQRIRAIEGFDRRGPFEIAADFVIDASGDGDISAKAGVPFTLGDGKGEMMGVTLSFLMIGASWERVFARGDPYFETEAKAGIAAGRLHPDLAKLYLMRGFHRDTIFCNTVHLRGIDGRDPDAVARATQMGRRRCHEVARFLIESVPGFEAARLAELGPTIGVRETRRLEARHRLRGAEIAAATKFADGIVRCDNPIDDVMRGEGAMTHEASVKPGDHYSIPFRALVPKRIENLLFAGRLVSADPTAFASIRGMPQCMAMGEAAGLAAALAVEVGQAIQNLDPALLIAALLQRGVRGIGQPPSAIVSGATR